MHPFAYRAQKQQTAIKQKEIMQKQMTKKLSYEQMKAKSQAEKKFVAQNALEKKVSKLLMKNLVWIHFSNFTTTSCFSEINWASGFVEHITSFIW